MGTFYKSWLCSHKVEISIVSSWCHHKKTMLMKATFFVTIIQSKYFQHLTSIHLVYQPIDKPTPQYYLVYCFLMGCTRCAQSSLGPLSPLLSGPSLLSYFSLAPLIPLPKYQSIFKPQMHPLKNHFNHAPLLQTGLQSWKKHNSTKSLTAVPKPKKATVSTIIGWNILGFFSYRNGDGKGWLKWW